MINADFMIQRLAKLAQLRPEYLTSAKIYELISTVGISDEYKMCYLDDVSFTDVTACLGENNRDCENHEFLADGVYRGKIVLSILEDEVDYVVPEVIKFLNDENINYSGYVANQYRNDSMVIGLKSQEDISKTFKFLQNPKIKKYLKETNPFIPSYNGVGFVNFSNNESYFKLLAKYFTIYFSEFARNNRLHECSVESFVSFLPKNKETVDFFETFDKLNEMENKKNSHKTI